MTTPNFSTTDIVLAASLKVIGFTMTHIEKNGNKGTFFFDNDKTGLLAFDDIDDAISAYDLGKLLVEPVAFNNAIKSLTTAARR